jgi:signal peptidase I
MAEPASSTTSPPKNALLTLYETRPLLAAALLLAGLALVPILGLVGVLREGWDAWASPAAALAAASLLPPVGVALRKSWGLNAAGYVCWFGIVLVALRAFTLGPSFLTILPAASYALVLSALSGLTRRAPSPAPAGAAAPDLPLAAWARENLEAIVVAFIMALVIRCFGIEVFKIPSSSMEPTLLGDVKVQESGRLSHGRDCDFEPYHRVSRTSSGDRIMVTKFFYALADIARYDVIVFKFPLNQSRNFIKRVVGLPDEEILLYQGNLFAKRAGDDDFHVTRRPPRTQEAIWINPASTRSFFETPADFERHWDVDGPPPSVRDGQLSRNDDGETWLRFKSRLLEDPDEHAVHDLRVAFELTPTNDKGEIVAEISNIYGKFELKVSATSDATLTWRGKDETVSDGARARLELGRRTSIELGVYDGLAYAKIDGHSPRVEFIKTRKAMAAPLSGEPSIKVGARDATFTMRDLKVGRDIHYKASSRGRRFEEDVPYRIGPNKYVVMGDNVTSSHDSRGWTKQSYKLASGELIEYESQQEFDGDVTPKSIQARYGLSETPNKLVADKYGRTWALYYSDPGPLPPNVPAGVIESEPASEDFYEIGENFIVGKALWVWWPPGRWFKLIR